MSNVLDNDTQQQIRALGRLGWTLSRIQEATGIRRETVSGYLKAAFIAVRSRGRPSESKAKPAISEEVSTDSGGQNRPPGRRCPPDSVSAPRPGRAPSASVRAVSRADHRGAQTWAQRDGDLAGPGRRPWFRRP